MFLCTVNIKQWYNQIIIDITIYFKYVSKIEKLEQILWDGVKSISSIAFY